MPPSSRRRRQAPSALDLFLLQMNLEMLRLPEPSQRVLRQQLQLIRLELHEAFSELLTDAQPDDQVPDSILTAAPALFRSAHRAIRNLSPVLLLALRSCEVRAEQMARRHIILMGQRFAPPGHVTGDLSRFLPDARDLAGRPALLGTARRFAREFPDALSMDLNRRLQLAPTRSETFHEMTRRLAGSRVTGMTQQVPLEARVDVVATNIADFYTVRADNVVKKFAVDGYSKISEENIAAVSTRVPDSMKQWNSIIDLRTCIECRLLHLESVPVGQPFSTGAQMPQLHWNCRCMLTYWNTSWVLERI